MERERTAAVARFLARRYGIPLLAGPARPGEEPPGPDEVVRVTLASGDARLILATTLWLSLVDPSLRLGGGWSEDERRRIAYLCELAACLARLRHPGEEPRSDGWAAEVTGIRHRSWEHRVRLFRSPAPIVPASRYGRRWGIEEPMAFSEYAAFQRIYLELRGRDREAA